MNIFDWKSTRELIKALGSSGKTSKNHGPEIFFLAHAHIWIRPEPRVDSNVKRLVRENQSIFTEKSG